MSLVLDAFALACDGERLARTGACPDLLGFVPSCVLERETPAGDPGEEVALPIAFEVFLLDFLDRSFIYIPFWYQSRRHQPP